MIVCTHRRNYNIQCRASPIGYFNDLLSTDRHQTELSQQDEDYFHTGDLYRTGVCSPDSSCMLILA